MDNGSLSFEDFKNHDENGIVYWWASDLMKMLGYPSMQSFMSVLGRTTKAFISLNIDYFKNIIQENRVINDEQIQDFRMTRFACYMAVMNGDPKKKEVAFAQAYFAEQTKKFEDIVSNKSEFDRVLIREEIKDGNKSLSSVAEHSGIEDYAKFQNAGYLGMYNMYNFQLAKKRQIETKKLFDTMGRTELAANLFRITQTEERIKSQNIVGQNNLENAHYTIGRAVRNLIIKNAGVKPEQLPQENALPDVKKRIKTEYKQLSNIDKVKKEK